MPNLTGAWIGILTTEKKCPNLKDMNVDEFFQDLKLENVQGDSLDELLDGLEVEIKKSLDIHAPEKVIKSGLKSGKIWFNKELRDHRKTPKNKEKYLENTVNIINGRHLLKKGDAIRNTFGRSKVNL